VVHARDVLRDAASHINAENIAVGTGIVHEHVNNVALHVGQGIGAAANVVHHHAEEAAAWARDEKNIEAVKDGAQVVAGEVNATLTLWSYKMMK
jgi:predicted RNA methylase